LNIFFVLHGIWSKGMSVDNEPFQLSTPKNSVTLKLGQQNIYISNLAMAKPNRLEGQIFEKSSYWWRKCGKIKIIQRLLDDRIRELQGQAMADLTCHFPYSYIFILLISLCKPSKMFSIQNVKWWNILSYLSVWNEFYRYRRFISVGNPII
jgi:hypothetical protein